MRGSGQPTEEAAEMVDGHSTVPLKRCTKCGTDKPATPGFFHAYKKSPDGRRSVCRACRSADHLANKAERNAKQREFYSENRERLNANVRAYYAENTEALRKAALARHYRNRERRLPQMRVYREQNRDRLLAEKRQRERQRFKDLYGQDVDYTLRHRMRALLRATVRYEREGRRLEQVLGYTMADLRAHLERQFTQGMTWEKVLDGSIEVDHIVPASTFNTTGYDCPEFKACWGMGNLRPMWARQNRSKGAKVLTLL